MRIKKEKFAYYRERNIIFLALKGKLLCSTAGKVGGPRCLAREKGVI